MQNKITLRKRRYPDVISARPETGDEEWQLSKDSADAATAFGQPSGREKKAELKL